MVTPAARRKAVADAHALHGVSERRACQALAVDRSSVRYRSRRPDDGVVRERLRVLSRERRRFGYRRLHLLLAREGHVMNQKKLCRLHMEEKLQVGRGGEAVSGSWARARRWWFPRLPISAGRWISSAMRWPMAVVSASWWSWMTSRGNAWRWLPTRRCRGAGSFVNWMHWSPDADGRRRSSATMAPNSPAWRCCAGARANGLTGITSPPASRCRTGSWKA